MTLTRMTHWFDSALGGISQKLSASRLNGRNVQCTLKKDNSLKVPLTVGEYMVYTGNEFR